MTDVARQMFGFLIMNCDGVAFRAIAMVCTDTRSPASKECCDILVQIDFVGWISMASPRTAGHTTEAVLHEV